MTSPSPAPVSRSRLAVWLGACAGASAIFVQTAWVCDDAFITFRVVDNIHLGLGARWNAVERVQAYTHPLWMGLLVLGRTLSSDLFHGAILLSYLLLLANLAVLWKLCVSPWRFAALCLVMFTSRSWVDYLSSGLENPLSHLLVLAQVWLVTQGDRPDRERLAFGVVSLGYLTRPDLVLILLPLALLTLRRDRTSFIQAALGLLPLAAWELTSLIYYGALLPNTAYAKLGTGIGIHDRLSQGCYYLVETLRHDSGAAGVIIAAMVLGGMNRSAHRWVPAIIGIASVSYVCVEGGDFMAGRFLTPLMAYSLAVVASLPASASPDLRLATLVPLGLTVAVMALNPPPWARWSTHFRNSSIDPHGVSDERGMFAPFTGLASRSSMGDPPDSDWKRKGDRLAEMSVDRRQVVMGCNIGMVGYYAGPNVHIIDPLALTEPFLARLPARPNTRVGHYERRIPTRYPESIASNEDQLSDPHLRSVLGDVWLVTRGPLFTRERWAAIWRLLSGVDSAEVASSGYLRAPDSVLVTGQGDYEPSTCLGSGDWPVLFVDR